MNHNPNFRNNINVKSLIRRHGIFGYGILWALIEDLYNNNNSLPEDYENISKDLSITIETLESIINEYGLFTVSDGKISYNGFQEKKVKEKVEFVPPSLPEVIEYFTSNGYTELSATRMFNYYSVANWKDSKGKQVVSWRQKAQSVWFKPENQMQPTNYKRVVESITR